MFSLQTIAEFVLIGFIYLACYVAYGASMYAIAEKREMGKLKACAWIPAARFILMGAVADDYERRAEGKLMPAHQTKIGICSILCIISIAIVLIRIEFAPQYDTTLRALYMKPQLPDATDSSNKGFYVIFAIAAISSIGFFFEFFRAFSKVLRMMGIKHRCMFLLFSIVCIPCVSAILFGCCDNFVYSKEAIQGAAIADKQRQELQEEADMKRKEMTERRRNRK